MNPTTALAFVLAATSLWLLADEGVAPARQRAGWTYALLIALTAIVKLGSFLDPDLGIDRLLFWARLDAFSSPNRMAPNTTFTFLLVGVGLLAPGLETRRGNDRPSCSRRYRA